MAFLSTVLFTRKENTQTHSHTNTHTQMPDHPPIAKHTYTQRKTHNLLPRIPRTQLAVWPWRCETRTEGPHSGEKNGSEKNTIQFQGTKHPATTWLLITGRVSTG